MDAPEVWFQDLSGWWYFVAPSFTAYVRLLVLHLGAPHWLCMYTEAGPTPIGLQWLRLLFPTRTDYELDRRAEAGTDGDAEAWGRELRESGGARKHGSPLGKTSAGRPSSRSGAMDRSPTGYVAAFCVCTCVCV